MKKIICIVILFLVGCAFSPKSPSVVTILESEHFPVRVEKDGGPFDTMSILDLIALKDFNEITITPVRKGDKTFTHYLVTQRALEKLRPKE